MDCFDNLSLFRVIGFYGMFQGLLFVIGRVPSDDLGLSNM